VKEITRGDVGKRLPALGEVFGPSVLRTTNVRPQNVENGSGQISDSPRGQEIWSTRNAETHLASLFPSRGWSGGVRACSATPAPSAPAASIEPPSGERWLLEVQAEGVQKYSCVTENGASAWKFQGPEAKLTTSTGSPAGSHFAGPTWKLLDGSEVKGSTAVSKPAPEAGAVPWLLVKVVSHTGEGKLSAAEYVTRTATKGGVAPQSGLRCRPSRGRCAGAVFSDLPFLRE
jgi:hypothetical protein